MKAGYGVILTELRREGAFLEGMALQLRARGGAGARVVTMPSDLQDPSEGVAKLHRSMRKKGYDVALLLVASDQIAYTGSFLAQPPENLDRMLALNVGSTSALCRLFGADMADAGCGRILLVGAPTVGGIGGVPGACAFAGSMAYVRVLADGLRQELVDSGVGISCLESQGLGRDGSLEQALASTCVNFLAPEGAGEPPSTVALLRASAATTGARPEPVAAETGDDAQPRLLAVPRDDRPYLDPDLAWSSETYEEAYALLARERGFTVLPGGAQIDRLQRSSPAELSNALLVGFVCTIFTVERLPGVSLQTRAVLSQINDVANFLFTLDYLARWWSRGLRWDYVFTPAMVFDLTSILPFILGPWVPALQGVQLNFLKLLRVLRVYRFFRPKAFQEAAGVLLPIFRSEDIDQLLSQVKPYQLQVVRTFGVVFTLLFITAGLVYEAEHDVNPQFQDFFSSLYFSVIALSTVGFGDFAPVTTAGRAAISVSIVVGLIIIPFQASLVAAAVSEEQRRKEEAIARTDAEALLTSLERSRAQLAWDAARIAELEDLEREERARIAELEVRRHEEKERDDRERLLKPGDDAPASAATE